MMKKFTKIGVIISGIVFVTGIVCCMISLIAGGSLDEVVSAATRAGVSCNAFDGRVSFDYGDSVEDSPEEPVELGKQMDLSVDIDAAELNFKTSDDGKFFVEAKGIKTSWNVDGNTIEISTLEKIFFWHHNNTSKITVYVPEGYKFRNVEIDCGAGSVEINDVASANMELSIGAGQIIAKNMDTGKLDVECGAGSVNMTGSVSGSIEIECSMGQVDLEVEQPEEYYNYQIECSMGEVNINGSSYAGMGVEKEVDNDSEYEMSIDCSMGDINIKTDKG